jgi:predicted AAA+ superfamily ATPase
VKHLRTNSGRHEVDLIIERPDQKILAIEVKLSASIHDDDVKNLHWLQEKIEADLPDMIVINTGPKAYRRKDGIAVIPAALLGL